MTARSALAGLALLSFTGCVRAPANNAQPAVAADVKGMSKDQKIRKLLQLTGAEDLGKQMMDGMMTQFETMPGLPPGFARKFREIAMKEDMVTMLIPVYAKHMQESDIDGAIVFFESNAGRNMSKAQPAILQESMAIGQQWGQMLAMKTYKALQEEKDDTRNSN
jgi:hypothetical protein